MTHKMIRKLVQYNNKKKRNSSPKFRQNEGRRFEQPKRYDKDNRTEGNESLRISACIGA